MKKLHFRLGIISCFAAIFLFLSPRIAEAQSDFNVIACASYEEAIGIIDTVLLGNVVNGFKKNTTSID